MLQLDRDIYRDRLGDPTSWSGDWRRNGRYLSRGEHQSVQVRMETHRLLVIGMAVRRHNASHIAAVLCVSREAVGQRLRQHGLNQKPGRRWMSQSVPPTV